MTAGRGIVHSEIPGNNEESHGLQLWVNLAKKDKLVDPAYQELTKDVRCYRLFSRYAVLLRNQSITEL